MAGPLATGGADGPLGWTLEGVLPFRCHGSDPVGCPVGGGSAC